MCIMYNLNMQSTTNQANHKRDMALDDKDVIGRRSDVHTDRRAKGLTKPTSDGDKKDVVNLSAVHN